MAGKSFFVDTTKCTGCRGCQVACKQWNNNPATNTRQRGTYQNPEDFSAATFKLVRFNEGEGPEGMPRWYFFPDQCRHCLAPLCQKVGDAKAKGAITRDGLTRGTLFNPAVKVSQKVFQEIREICPFDIPRYNEKLGSMAKCTMCFDRVGSGMLPACVQACPTGAMQFGNRDVIRKIATKRFDEVRITHKRAELLHPGAVRVIFLVNDHPEKYHKFAATQKDTGGSTIMAELKRRFDPAELS